MTQYTSTDKRSSWLSGLGMLATMVTAVVTWRLARFWRRLQQLPRLTSVITTTDPSTAMIDQAVHIAAANVRGAIEERPVDGGQRKLILNAGWRNFREPWARDFGFASFGLIELEEHRALRETLELFLHFQMADGHFPVKIHSTNVLERSLYSFFGRQQPVHSPLRPKYKTAHNTLSLDGNALIIIAALNYLRRVNDESFARTHWPALKRGLLWLERQALAADGLLHQGAYTDWADSIKRAGIIHYTNVLYWQALHSFAEDAVAYGYDEDQAYFAARANQVRQAINAHFWHEDLGFYGISLQFPHILSSAGNLLAIAWGLTSTAQANAILDNMQILGMANPVPTRVTSQPYGTAFIAIENRLAGIPHYHTSAAWLWLGAWHVIALVRSQRLAGAGNLLERMSAVIVRDGVVHEVYGQDGRHLATRWYTSEAPLTWSASLFLYAQAVYQRARLASLGDQAAK